MIGQPIGYSKFKARSDSNTSFAYRARCPIISRGPNKYSVMLKTIPNKIRATTQDFPYGYHAYPLAQVQVCQLFFGRLLKAFAAKVLAPDPRKLVVESDPTTPCPIVGETRMTPISFSDVCIGQVLIKEHVLKLFFGWTIRVLDGTSALNPVASHPPDDQGFVSAENICYLVDAHFLVKIQALKSILGGHRHPVSPDCLTALNSIFPHQPRYSANGYIKPFRNLFPGQALGVIQFLQRFLGTILSHLPFSKKQLCRTFIYRIPDLTATVKG